MARSLIEEFKLENPQYKDVDDGVFKSAIVSDFKSQFPQYKDMGDDFFAPMLNPTEKTTMEKAAGGATGLVKKAASAFVPSIPKTPGEAVDKTFPPVAIDKKVASVNQDLEESVDKYPLAYNGLDRMNAAMARTPAFAYDVAMLPGNLMRKAMGQPEPQVQSPDWLMNNKVAEFYDESVRQTDYVNKRWEGVSFEDVVKRADAKEITEYILHNVMASAPQNLAFLSLAASGYGTAGLIGMGLISAADEAKRARDMGKDPAASTLNAAAVGTFEAAFERMGTLSFIEKWGGQLAKSFGKDTAFGIMKNVGKALVSSFVTEGSEELATSLSQDFSRYATGIDPNALKGSVWRGLGAFAVGGVAGTMMTTPATIATGLESAVTTINPETLSPETMAQLDKNLPAVSGFLKKIPTINVAPEKVNEAIITASVAKVEAISKGKSPEEAEIDSLHAFTKTLDPEPLVQKRKKMDSLTDFAYQNPVNPDLDQSSDILELDDRKMVNRKGKDSLDAVALRAIEYGFLPEGSTGRDYIEALHNEQAGRFTRSSEDEYVLPERPIDSMSLETIDREIDRFQDMLAQGKAGKSIQQKLGDLLETRKRMVQAQEEDMPDWVTEPLEGLEPDITPQKTVSSPTPGQMQGDAELARLARANQVEDDLIVSLVDKIDRNDVAFEEGYERKFDEQRDEIKASYTPSPGAGIPAMIHIAAGGKSRNAIHEFDHFAWDNLYTDQHKAILIDAFGDGKKAREDEADAMGLYLTEGTSGNSLVDKVFYEIKQFIERFGQWMKGRGFQSAHDIFKAIDGGKLGKRKARVYTERDVQFSVEPKNDELDKYFSDTASDILSSKRFPDAPIPVATKPSAALKIAGAHDIPIVTITSVITKARGKHGLTADQIQQIPAQLRDPVMVFESDNYPNSISVITEFKNKDGKPVDVQIHMDQSMGRGKYLVHKISSIGEREAGQILRWIKDGKLRYENTKKKTALFQSLQIRSLLEGTSPSKSSLQPDGLQLPKGEGASTIPETPKSVKPQFSVERKAPTFFSAAEVILKEKMPNMASVEQVRAILSGIKQEEVKWLGLDQFLEGKDRVTKAELLDFIRQNQVQIKEVMRGEGSDVKNFFTRMGYSPDEFNALPADKQSELWDEYKQTAQNTDSDKGTKFHSYQLPGGENYRELLLTLPGRASDNLQALLNRRAELEKGAIEQQKDLPPEKVPEWKEINRKIHELRATMPANFQSSHFDEPNILAHVRFNERTGPKGERILFLEEVQSDWHQKGREKGYAGQAVKATQGEAKEFFGIKDESWEKMNNEARQSYADELSERKTKGLDTVPDAPFKKTWHELALKRMLRYAAENGFDRIAWTTGDIQNDRYDLSKQLESVVAKKVGEFGFDLWATPRGGKEFNLGIGVKPEKIADFVGKDLAEKIVKDGGGEYSGLDLRVGGDGMRGFYDQIIPSFLNKYAKKWGGRVGTTEISVGDEIGKFQVVLPNGKVVATESTRRLAENTAKNFVGSTIKETSASVHSLDITPSMKRDVLEVGQIQFSVERKDEPQVGQAIKAISDSIKAKEVGGDYTLGDGETIKAEDLVDSMTFGEVTKEKAAGFLKAVKKGIHFLELPQNYLYAHEDSKPVAEGVIDAFVARERREHDIEEFKRVALSAPNKEALAEIIVAADRDNDVNIFAELTKAVKAGKITQADKDAFTKGLYFMHKAAKDQLVRDILSSRHGVRIKSMGSRYFVTYETKDGKVQERWITKNQMKQLESRGTKVTVLEEKEQIKVKRGDPNKGEIVESIRKVSSYDEALSILNDEEKQLVRELLPYKNYIPHARRGGKFWVEAYDQEGQKVYSARVPNESVAARMSELIGKEHPDWRIDAHPHSEKMRITPSFGSMADVAFFMNQNGIDPTSEPGQRIINAYRSVSPLMASLIHSQNIAGYKVDWESIVDSMALMASSGSGRAYRLDVKDLMDEVKNIKDDFRFNTALQYVNALSEVQEDMPVVLQSIKSLTYFWLLANKSTYVIQNLTEPIWALARIESIKNPAGFAIVLNDEYKALLNRATEEGILKPFFSEQALAMNPLENLQKLDVLGRASEVWSSRKVFEIGLRLARDNGLRGDEAYRYAYQFLFNKGKPFYSTANKPIGMLGKGWAVNRQYGFMLLNFMFDWLGKFARGMLRNKLMTLMAWVLLGGFGTLPFGRKLMELFKFQFEKNARNYDLLDRFMLGGVAGMLGISPSFIVPTVLKGIPLPSVNPFRSIDIIGNQIGFAAKSYEKYGIVGAAGYLPLAGGQYILRGQARLKEGFKDNKKIIYRPKSAYEKVLVGAGLNPFEVNEHYRTEESAK